jgi:hypothetical protein
MADRVTLSGASLLMYNNGSVRFAFSYGACMKSVTIVRSVVFFFF